MNKNMEENNLEEETTVDAEPEKTKDSNPGVDTQQTHQEMDSKRSPKTSLFSNCFPRRRKNQERVTANKDKKSLTGALAASLGTSLSVAGIDQTTTDAAVQAENFHSNPKTSLLSKVRSYCSQRRKGAAKNSDRASKILEFVAEATGISPIKAFSLAFKEAAAYLTKKERKELKKKAKIQLESRKLWKGKKKTTEYQKLTVEEEKKILDELGLTKEDIETKYEFQDLKNEIDKLQGKVDRLLDMVSSMRYLKGCDRILVKFRLMSERDENDMSVWVNAFHKNKDNFSESLSDFTKNNVCDYLKYVYETKCHDNMEDLFEAFGFLVQCRALYLLILAKYYANVTDHIFNENPDLNPEERILKELEQCEREIEEIEKAADSVVGVEGGGFIAMMTSKENLGYVPRFQDISDGNTNYIGDYSQKDLVIMPMDENVKYKVFSKEGKKVLHSSEPVFIRCKSTNEDYETIVAIKDGVVHRASGFRTKFENGSECLGKVISTNVEIMYMGEKMVIYSKGNMKQWKKDLVWEDIKEKKEFTEYFGKTPEYYLINPKEVKLDMNIHEAAKHGKIGIVKCLLLQGVKVDEKDSFGCCLQLFKGRTPLMLAAYKGHMEVVKYLVNYGANVKEKSNNGATPLMFAAWGGHLEVVNYLANNGANVNDKDDDGWTPLFYAANTGYLEVVKFLINKEANVNDKDNKGWTPLMKATNNKHLEVVKYLANNGANVSDKDDDGWTPLIYATTRGHLEIVKYLANNGANLNDKSKAGWTPLMQAAKEGHLEVVKYLANNGANVNDKSGADRTALWYADFNKHTEVAAFLRSIGGEK